MNQGVILEQMGQFGNGLPSAMTCIEIGGESMPSPTPLDHSVLGLSVYKDTSLPFGFMDFG